MQHLLTKSMKMRNWIKILFLLLILFSCKKSDDISDQSKNHSNGYYFVASVGGEPFVASDIGISVNCNYPNISSCVPFIYASTQTPGEYIPPYSFFFIYLLNTTPGEYYLGKLGAKRDSTNYYTGVAYYSIKNTSSTIESYETDSIFNGILTITKHDTLVGQINGTFSFTCRKINTSDTILLTVSNGCFQGQELK
jgi:hypothetical protein